MPNDSFDASARDDRVNEVIAAYLHARQAGQAPDSQEWLRRHPEITAELAEYFADQEQFDRLAAPLQGAFVRSAGFSPSAPPRAEARTTNMDATTPDSPSPQVPAPRLDNFGDLEEIGRGGMGVVYRLPDPDLGRNLALKVLLEEHRDRPELVQRFIEEAQVLGQLQHPGVVPIHARGQLADGRPFFTMKLIKGKTLADLLAKPAPLDLPRFLAIFEKVCQTLAYAHARGVIHRDLKPSNVMVGAFGEVQVMDWGLAKVIGQASSERPRAEALDASTIYTVRTQAPGLESQAGAVLGTYAYMPPEQARGAVEQLDERCDVFGLGAILCAILTGQPPYTGLTREDLRRQAQMGDLADALERLTQCVTDSELVELTRKCLASDREQRPRDAGAVAEAVSAYRAAVQERLRAAELAAARAAAKATEERKRRRLMVALAAAVLLLVFGGGGVWMWIKQERVRRREAMERTVETALAEAALLQRQAKWDEALAATRQAGELLTDHEAPELAERVSAVRTDLEIGKRLEDIRLRHADRMKNSEFDFAGADAAFAKAFREYGIDVAILDADAAAERIAASPLKEQLVAALDDWARDRLENDQAGARHLLAIAGKVDPDQWRDRFRIQMVQRDRQALEKLARRPEVADMTPATVALLADALARAGAVPTAVKVLKQAQQHHPNDFWLNHELAFYLVDLGPERVDEVVSYYRAALALRPNSPGAHYNLGNALFRQGKLDEAEAAYRQAIELQADYSFPYNNLGVVLGKRGKNAEAIASFRKAIAAQPNNVNAYYNLGNALLEQREHTEAIAVFRAITKVKPKDASAYATLGRTHYQLGQLAEAVAQLRQAVVLAPNEAGYYSNLGLALTDFGKHADAVAACSEAIRLDPKDPVARKNRGVALARKGDLAAAIADYQEALRLRPKDSQAYSNLSFVYLQQKTLGKAVEACDKAIAIDPKNADAHHNRGLALFHQGHYDQAAASFRQAVAIRPQAGSYLHLALSVEQLGKLDEAEKAYKEALRLKPKDAQLHYNLGVILEACKKYGEAVEAYRQAIKLAPQLEVAHCNLGIALERQNKYAAAEKAYRQAIKLDKDDALAHYGLGRVLKEQGQFEAALACLRQAHALGSKNPSWDHPTAEWVQMLEHLVELDRKLAAIQRGEAEPADGPERIDLAHLCQQDFKRLYATAARLYADAFATEPKLADSLRAGHRYNAACAAALAGCGQGRDAGTLDEKERARLRQQALDWLQSDLAVWSQVLDKGPQQARPVARRTLAHWQTDADLAGLRDKPALANLPQAEREAWQKLWQDVEALKQRVGPERELVRPPKETGCVCTLAMAH
jgi:serine/threonine-protein kinase